MADLPISLLPTAEGLDPADLLPIVNNGVTKKITVRTIGGTPLDLGPTVAASSVPVVVATDQLPVPVREVNKEATQVSLSLLGIPRSEVALGIFGDVNTYDVNPLEWTSYPQITGNLANVWGVKHLSAESAAQISCPLGFYEPGRGILYFSRLTSKRYFRYQPGRVSSGTFGVRLDTSLEGAPAGLSKATTIDDTDAGGEGVSITVYNRNSTCKKWGCFDNLNGYYFEARGDGNRDNFLVVRRTNSIPPNPIYARPGQWSPDVVTGSHPNAQTARLYAGIAGEHAIIVRDKLVLFHAALFDTTMLATSADQNQSPPNITYIMPYVGYETGQELPPPDLVAFYDYHWKNFGSTSVGRTRWDQFLQDLYYAWAPFDNGSGVANKPIAVKKEYANVYEYRVPRSCFNFDNMNGESNLRRWSDYFDGNVTGQVVQEDGQDVYVQSVKNLDFTKVTMYKIEYSWYGAVGAQFLAYVPVSNSLARWVRIHHLRVSNQIGSPSLGNPTLPFTYLNIGGAGNIEDGDKIVQRVNKYGASYLIDGGDKGTVNINTVATDNEKRIYPDRQVLTVNTLSANEVNNGIVDLNNLQNNEVVNFLSGVEVRPIEGTTGFETRGIFSSWHIGARLYGTDINGNQVYPGVSISDISHDGRLAFITENKPVGVSAVSVQLTAVTGRGTPVLGIRVKNQINNIRNRSQVYPTRLSFGTSKPVLLQLVKNPYFASLSGIASPSNLLPAFIWHTSQISVDGTTPARSLTVNATNPGPGLQAGIDYHSSWNYITQGGTQYGPYAYSIPPLTARAWKEGLSRFDLVNKWTAAFEIPASTEEVLFSTVVYFNRNNCVIPLIRENLGKAVLGSFYGIKGILKLKSFGCEDLSSEADVLEDNYQLIGGIPMFNATFSFRRLAAGNPKTVNGCNDESDYDGVGQTGVRRTLKRGAFIPELPMRGDSEIIYNASTAAWQEDRPLIAVEEDIYEQRTPVPATGEVLASFNVATGGVDLDLSPYFGFDKQYLSFPLVEGGDPDMLFLTARALDGKDTIAVGGGSMTWEEQ
jgi:hypothetical protein